MTQTARKLEEADTIHIARQVEACAALFPDQRIYTLPVGHGIASFTLPSLGQKLNRIEGFGMSGAVSGDDLAVAEKMYANLGLPTEVHLCPHAHPTAIQALSGYSVVGWIKKYACSLTDVDLVDANMHGIEIAQVTAEQSDTFLKISYEGFRSNGRSKKLLETLASNAIWREDTRLYFAIVDGRIAGSAGMAMIETSRGKVAHLYLDSTLAEYRGRGIHLALLRARLSEAKKAGYDFASVAARPGSISARNIERVGFGLAYTTATVSKASARETAVLPRLWIKARGVDMDVCLKICWFKNEMSKAKWLLAIEPITAPK